MLADKNVSYKKKEERLLVKLDNSMEALALLEDSKAYIEGFEVMQGTMDDVFLQITGKSVAEQEENK